MTVIHLGNNDYRGLSSDTKPTNVPAGATFEETDTNFTQYSYDGSIWQLKDIRSSASFIGYIAGSTIKVKNSVTGKIDYSGTDATTVLNSCLTATKGTGQKLSLLSNNTFSLTGTLNLSSLQSIGGESPLGLARLYIPSGDFSAITVSETSGNQNRACIENLYLTHNSATYGNTTGLIRLSTSTGHGVTSNLIQGCYFYDFGQNRGNAVKYDVNDAPIYKTTMHNCEVYGLNDQIYITFQGINANNSFCSSNFWSNCNFWNPNNTAFMVNATSVNQGFIGNSWTNCFVQSVANTQCGWDLSTNSTASQWTNNAWTNCLVWDLTSGKDAWKFNSTTEGTLINCYPTYKIGGAGATNGKINKFDTYSSSRGTYQANGTGSQKTFTVSTNLPTTGGTINPNTLKGVSLEFTNIDAVGNYYISSTDCSAFTVNYITAPPSGTNNVSFYWTASS